MLILIDTHTFLWFFSDQSRMSPRAIEVIEFEGSATLVSIVSIWEISIRNAKGHLDILGGFQSIPQILKVNDISILPVEFQHVLEQNGLPHYHRDPFDRMTAAQALVEEFNLISIDDVFDSYFEGSEVNRIW